MNSFLFIPLAVHLSVVSPQAVVGPPVPPGGYTPTNLYYAYSLSNDIPSDISTVIKTNVPGIFVFNVKYPTIVSNVAVMQRPDGQKVYQYLGTNTSFSAPVPPPQWVPVVYYDAPPVAIQSSPDMLHWTNIYVFWPLYSQPATNDGQQFFRAVFHDEIPATINLDSDNNYPNGGKIQ